MDHHRFSAGASAGRHQRMDAAGGWNPAGNPAGHDAEETVAERHRGPGTQETDWRAPEFLSNGRRHGLLLPAHSVHSGRRRASWISHARWLTFPIQCEGKAGLKTTPKSPHARRPQTRGTTH